MTPGPWGNIPPSRNEAEGASVLGNPVHMPHRVCMEIPGGSQGRFQFRITCFIFVPLSFLFLLSPSGGRGGHRKLEDQSKCPHWAESQEDQCGEMGVLGR